MNSAIKRYNRTNIFKFSYINDLIWFQNIINFIRYNIRRFNQNPLSQSKNYTTLSRKHPISLIFQIFWHTHKFHARSHNRIRCILCDKNNIFSCVLSNVTAQSTYTLIKIYYNGCLINAIARSYRSAKRVKRTLKTEADRIKRSRDERDFKVVMVDVNSSGRPWQNGSQSMVRYLVWRLWKNLVQLYLDSSGFCDVCSKWKIQLYNVNRWFWLCCICQWNYINCELN